MDDEGDMGRRGEGPADADAFINHAKFAAGLMRSAANIVEERGEFITGEKGQMNRIALLWSSITGHEFSAKEVQQCLIALNENGIVEDILIYAGIKLAERMRQNDG